MSRITELIKEKCPNGVEFFKLADIGYQYNGLSGKIKNDFENGNYKYITYSNIYNNPSIKLNINDCVSIKEGEKQNEIKFKDVLVTGSSENLEDSGMVSVVTMEPNEKIFLNSFCFGFRLNEKFYDKYNANFLKHLFRNSIFRSKIISCSFGVTRYNLSKEKFLKIKIPCPPLEVQEEIARILDKFGELEAELEAELEVRKQQYEFWRGTLLNKNNNIVKISEITTNVYSGKCSSRNKHGEYPVYGSTGIIAQINEYRYDIEKILIARVGANAGFVHIASGKYDVTDNTLIMDLKENANIKYIYYYLQNYNLNKMAKGGGQPLITAGQIKDFEINIPPVKEQQRIVSILDKFDKLLNDISEGLPAEIELRKKQCEYYRNKLLNFEELKNEQDCM